MIIVIYGLVGLDGLMCVGLILECAKQDRYYNQQQERIRANKRIAAPVFKRL